MGFSGCSDTPAAGAAARTPRVWIFFGPNAGDNSQLRGLADAIGWPYESKHLRWTDPVAERVRAFSGVDWRTTDPGFDRSLSSPIEPPWPDLVVSADILCSWTALWIRSRAGPQTRLVRFGNPRGLFRAFDLMITLPQYAVPSRSNVVRLPEPVTSLAKGRLQADAAVWEPRFAHLPRPWHALLVGGPTKQYPFDETSALPLAQRMNDLVRREGGSLLISTSPRTPEGVIEVLEAELEGPRFLHRWARGNVENPYFAYLELADSIVVTADSATMLAEACAMRKRVFIYRPREHFRLRALVRKKVEAGVAAVRRRLEGMPGSTLVDRMQDWLHEKEIVRFDRDLGLLHQALIARGLASSLEGVEAISREQAPTDEALAEAASQIRMLFKDVETQA